MPVVTDDLVYLLGRAYAPADGRRLWELDRSLQKSLEGYLRSIVGTPSTLFFAEIERATETRSGISLFAVDTADGTLRWRRTFHPTSHNLRVVGDRLVVGTFHGEVYVLGDRGGIRQQ